jgi:CHAT domain-containing protein
LPSLWVRLAPARRSAAATLEVDAGALFRAGRVPESQMALTAAAAVHRSEGSTWRAARLAPLHGQVLLALGETEAAGQVAVDGIAILGGTGDARATAVLQVIRGLSAVGGGDRGAAKVAYLEANRLRRLSASDAIELDLLLGRLALALGWPALAERALDRAGSAPLRGAGDRQRSHRLQSEIHRYAGAISDAVGERGIALRIGVDRGDLHGTSVDLLALADLLRDAGRPSRAALYAAEGLRVSGEAGAPRLQAQAHVQLGRLSEDVGGTADAACHYVRAQIMDRARLGAERYWADAGLWRIGHLCPLEAGQEIAASGVPPRMPGEGAGSPAITSLSVEAAAMVARGLLERGDRAGASAALEHVARLLEGPLPLSAAWRVHHLVGVTLRELGDVVRARVHHDTALAMLDRLRPELGAHGRRADHTSTQRGFYEAAVDAWVGRSTPPPPLHCRERGFAAAQALKSRGVLGSLQSRAGVELPHREARGMREERVLLRRLSEVDDTGVARLELLARLPEIWRAGRSESSAQPEVLPTLGQVSARLGEGDVLLEYLMGEHRSYLWVLTRDGNRVEYLPGLSEVRGPLGRFQESLMLPTMTRQQRREHSAAGVELARLLLGGEIETVLGARRLIVATDGPLHGLPFAALVVSERAINDAPDYLIRHLPVTQVPSAAAWWTLDGRPSRREEGGLFFVGVGDPSLVDGLVPFRIDVEFEDDGVTFVASAPRARLARLPHARRELWAISSLLGRSRSVVLIGDKASETRLRKAGVEGARYVHFATHGVTDAAPRLPGGLVDDSRWDEPALVLSPDAGSDGLLSVEEILGLELAAELVVLSGCSTGRGWREGGAESYGLSSAFLRAGSRRVIASLWSVADRQTRRLMVRLYRELQGGLAPDEALRRAQLAMLGRPAVRPSRPGATRGVQGISTDGPRVVDDGPAPFTPPYFWASFVVIGG